MDVQMYRERFLICQCDVITGSEQDFASCKSSVTDPDSELDVHSDDYKGIIEQDVIAMLFSKTFSFKICIKLYFIL